MKFNRIGVAIVLLASILAMVGCNLPVAQPNSASKTATPTLSVDEILGTPLPAEVLLENATASPVEPLATPTLAATPLAGQTATPAKAVCGGPDALIITVLGIDEHAQADAIRLVRIDFVKQEVTTLAIPRDFWVQVVDMGVYGIDENRINATYGFGEYYNGAGQGIVSLNRNLESNFGVQGERYVVLHFSQIAEYIDIIGGVDLVLDKPVEDGKVYFSASEHHFDGETAVSFMRVRYYDNDFQRVKRQTQVLTAFFKKLTSEMDPGMLLNLAKRVLTANPPITDLKLSDMTAGICLARQLDKEKVTFKAIPADLFHHAITNRGAAVLAPHPEAAEYIQAVILGGR